jgi:hypothetical protein
MKTKTLLLSLFFFSILGFSNAQSVFTFYNNTPQAYVLEIHMANGSCGSITSPIQTIKILSISAGSCQTDTVNLGYGVIVYKIEVYEDISSCSSPQNTYCNLNATNWIATMNCSLGSTYSWSSCSGSDQAYVDWNNSCSLDD